MSQSRKKKRSIILLVLNRGKCLQCFDFGASKHMTNRRDRFVYFVEKKSKTDVVIVDDGSNHFARGS